MCLGQKSPDHAIDYLNAQLSSLYESSTKCLERFGDLRLGERARHNGFALAEFYVGAKKRSNSKDDTMFSANFSRPRLEFICNHKAILYLGIKEGHFNREIAKADSTTFVPDPTLHVKFQDMEAAFLVKFGVQTIHNNTTGRSQVIQLVVFDFRGTRLVSRVSADDRELEFYMKRYLNHLHEIGHNVLFSIPGHDHSDMVINYSLNSCIKKNPAFQIREVFGISIGEINRDLSSKWLKSIMDPADSGADPDSFCLAEYSSTWKSVDERSDIQFDIKFGAPRIEALCEHEVVLYFKIDELHVYEGHNFTSTKHESFDWELATVVNLTTTEGSFRRIEIDMNTLRVCEHLSGQQLHSFGSTLKTMFVTFIQERYAQVLRIMNIHIIDLSRQLTTLDIDETEDSIHVLWRPDMIDMRHYDSVQVVSEQSINWYFRNLWNKHSKLLNRWSRGDEFTADFGALKVRYLPGEKAIVWIKLDSWKPKSLSGSGFSDWSIAFEVDLKIIDHKELKLSESSSWLRESFSWKHHGSGENRALKHLILNFTGATTRFVYELSSFGRLELSKRSAVDNVTAAVRYLKEYFHELEQHGYHVLQTVPVWTAKPPPTGLTGVTFQICSRGAHNRHVHDYRDILQHDTVLMLLGMTGFRPIPSDHLEYSTDRLVEGKTTTHGTICLSEKAFLAERLLTLLARVNAATTMTIPFFSRGGNDGFVPLFNGYQGMRRGPVLTTWARHTDEQPHWVSLPASNIGRSYKWDHADRWSYEHQGSRDEHNGTYAISCQTKNQLHLPTTTNHGALDIVMRGEIDINLRFGGSVRWESKAVAKWSVILSMISPPGGGGLVIEVRGDTRPKFETFRVDGDVNIEQHIDLRALHELVVVDLDDLVVELRQLFGGVWGHSFPGMQAYSLSNPVFNSSGDILFDLRPYVSQSEVAQAKPRPSRTSSRSSSVAFDGIPLGEKPANPGPKSPLGKINEGFIHAGQSIGGVLFDSTSVNIKEKTTSGSTVSTSSTTKSSTMTYSDVTKVGADSDLAWQATKLRESPSPAADGLSTTVTKLTDYTPAMVPVTSTTAVSVAGKTAAGAKTGGANGHGNGNGVTVYPAVAKVS